jgi:hypothetical protein
VFIFMGQSSQCICFAFCLSCFLLVLMCFAHVSLLSRCMHRYDQNNEREYDNISEKQHLMKLMLTESGNRRIRFPFECNCSVDTKSCPTTRWKRLLWL